uniref:Uncharacterized protein n=1 Tax=Oryza rufipogon TaxID=4529 RepID=A0A0E0P8H6_ORYRU
MNGPTGLGHNVQRWEGSGQSRRLSPLLSLLFLSPPLAWVRLPSLLSHLLLLLLRRLRVPVPPSPRAARVGGRPLVAAAVEVRPGIGLVGRWLGVFLLG